MNFAVVYAKDASDDIDAAVEWLVSRAPAAAADLLRTNRRVEIHLTRNPAIYRVVKCAAT